MSYDFWKGKLIDISGSPITIQTIQDWVDGAKKQETNWPTRTVSRAEWEWLMEQCKNLNRYKGDSDA